jgi:hypothetical protein
MRILTLIAALAALASPSLAQAPARPAPTLFTSTACDVACARARWGEVLKSHGEAELTGQTGTSLRLTTFSAEVCAGQADTLLIRRITLGDKPSEDRMQCGARSRRALEGEDLAVLTKALATPDLADLKGAFPAYCGEFEGADTHEFHLLEFLDAGRYRLIEWDCETPRPLKPLQAWFDRLPRLP